MDTFSIGSPSKLAPFLREALRYSFDDLGEIIPEWVSSERLAELDNVGITVRKNQLQSVDKNALEPFSSHPVVFLVLEYRKLKKIVSTYLTNWIMARDADNIVHSNMNVDGTVAGRFSSSGNMGNAQNIPDRGYTIKRVFVPYDNEHILFAIDYGQLEARVASWVAETLLPSQGAYTVDETPMTNLFNSGIDMHSYTRDTIGVRDILYPGASTEQILTLRGVDLARYPTDEDRENEVNSYFRFVAKTLNFGLLYSGGANMVMKLLKIERDKAQGLVERWRTLFPVFKKAQVYYNDLALTWRDRPDGLYRAMYVTQPLTGRHRKIDKYPTHKRIMQDGQWVTFNPQESAARKVWNNVVQGLSGQLTVDAALRFGDVYGWRDMRLFAQIHDALEGQITRDNLVQVKYLMEFMVDYPEIKPALTVDLEAGLCWQPGKLDNEMHKVHDIDLWVNSGGYDGYKKGK
jgi:DNA polymerase-1